MQLNRLILTTVAFVIFGSFLLTHSAVEFVGAECFVLDKSFTGIEYCYMKTLNHTHKYFSLKVLLHKKPVSNVTVNLSFMKKERVYKPFLYNVTFDACAFLKRRHNSLVKFLYDFLERYSNMNHTCPFQHDLIVDKLDLYYVNNRITKILPIPVGEYALFTTWSAYGRARANVNFFMKLLY